MTNRLGLNISIGILTALLVAISFGQGGLVAAPTADTVSDYLDQISSANLVEVATVLVNHYGPRREDAFSPFIDANCTTSSTVYPKTTLDMSADYIKGNLRPWAILRRRLPSNRCPATPVKMSLSPRSAASIPMSSLSLVATRFSGSSSPGGADNASGHTAVIELARVLKDYPNRYSMRFVLWAAEEYHVQRGAYYGSNYHVQQALARGEAV